MVHDSWFIYFTLVTAIKSSDFILIVYILMTFRVIGHDVVFCFFYPDESTWHGFWRNVLRIVSFLQLV